MAVPRRVRGGPRADSATRWQCVDGAPAFLAAPVTLNASRIPAALEPGLGPSPGA